MHSNLTKCSHGRAGRHVIILIDASPLALIKIQKAAVRVLGTYEPSYVPLCHPKAPVTDDIIGIVKVTWELVVGTRTIQTDIMSYEFWALSIYHTRILNVFCFHPTMY